MINTKYFFINLIFILLFVDSTNAYSAGITYSGRLLDPIGNAVVSSNVQFRLQIRTPGNENCLMYEEVQTKDMTNSDGVFSITINDGTGARTDSTGYALDQIFANRGSFSFTAGYCVTGYNYSPNSTDGRKLQVYFNDGSFATGQWEPTPSIVINFIPMAIESQQVGGYKKEQLIKIADGVSATGTELDSTRWTNLLALINGTSTAFVKPTDQVTQLYGATVPAPANGQSIRWNSALNAGTGGWENFAAGTASAVTAVSSTNADIGVTNGSTTPQLTLNSGTSSNQIVKLDGTAKLPAVDGSALTNVNSSKVGGTTVNLASLTSGQVLKYNGTNWVNALDADALGGLSCANGRVAYYSSSAWSCLEVNSSNIVNTLVARDSAGESVFGSLSTGILKVNDGAAGAISIITPVAVTSYSMRLPATVGTNGYALTTDAGNPAQLSWSPMTSSQWSTSGSDIYYNSGKIGIGVVNPTALTHIAGANTSSAATLANVLTVVGANNTSSGGGSSISLTAGGSYSGTGGSITLVAGQNTGGPHNGASLILGGGAWGGGGGITLAAGHNGGGGPALVNITGSNGNMGGNQTGGAVNISGGNGTGNYMGGAINLTGGNGGTSNGNGANVLINGGAKNGTGSDGNVILVNSRGNVGIGTVNPVYSLHVLGTSSTVAFFSDGVQSCSITPSVAGNVSCSSDERLKTDIQDFSDKKALEKILKLNTVTYQWKFSRNGYHTGYLAQEVEKIAPEFVITGKDGYKQVSYSGFIPLITGAIKALRTEQASNEKKIDELIRSIEEIRLDNDRLKNENAEIKTKLKLNIEYRQSSVISCKQ